MGRKKEPAARRFPPHVAVTGNGGGDDAAEPGAAPEREVATAAEAHGEGKGA